MGMGWDGGTGAGELCFHPPAGAGTGIKAWSRTRELLKTLSRRRTSVAVDSVQLGARLACAALALALSS